MTLTTPVPRDQDTVFPGENWFFYWKTSASLWKTKLQEFPGTKIIIPLNWSFHSETGDQFDFGEHRPETNLKKLVEIAQEVGKMVVFFLPVTPAPFLPNGGLPHLLARSIALNGEHMAYGVIDADDHLVKIYSFFDPRVFEAFDKFVKKLGQYFSQATINADVWGIRSGYFKEGQYRSFIEDSSKTFEQAFHRFLQTKKSADETLSPIEERALSFEFNKTIQNLYETNARESIKNNFEGTLDVAFLGAGTDNFLKRLSGTISTVDYSGELYEALAKDIIPSSVLLPHRLKKGVLTRELNDLVANSYLPARLASSAYDHDDINMFQPLSFFKVYERVDGVSSLFQNWNDLHLWPYLKGSFGWSYKVISNDTLKLHENKTPYQEHIHLFHGHDVDRTIFNYILKTFMNGGRVILNRSGLSDEFAKRFETFFLENNLNVEKVHFQTQIQNIALGEGRLVLIEGEGFKEMDKNDYLNFWKTLVETFSLVHVPIQNVDGIDFYWRTRPSSANELKFEEVRRLSLYNPTSYRKKIKMSLTKNFVVYKVIDEINVIVQTYPNEIEIELSPEGSVIVDFGVFS
ncbi:hypothetical protein DOM21_04435 [Bacteriovorax stolpii]|uniref:Uncharacterized protein n=1 Tax=Bacteriovorax stolpii TaxID=960 RepID=A0A2K9NUU8_BACTC|nr:hypothetical protein [Bacteriovorax stolpii]AUN99306.1 hypothetical protein C0V70_14565 [Bacteriovorax stolpii]QDK40713.1 hypothetical protein DOM21_04435 [Bacteriovorax stolpii]TDP55154.1 hypothetical protein C8D79_0197 [Bacteriovorax stolpii]BDT29478.1 hypothetical protein BHI3_29440 [Bacteriovorax sp. HI3]